MVPACYFLIVYKKVEDSGGPWRLSSTINHLYIKRLYYEWRIFLYFQTFGIFLFFSYYTCNKIYTYIQNYISLLRHLLSIDSLLLLIINKSIFNYFYTRRVTFVTILFIEMFIPSQRISYKDMNKLKIKRIYLPYDDEAGYRILIVRLWPRGISKINK